MTGGVFLFALFFFFVFAAFLGSLLFDFAVGSVADNQHPQGDQEDREDIIEDPAFPLFFGFLGHQRIGSHVHEGEGQDDPEGAKDFHQV